MHVSEIVNEIVHGFTHFGGIKVVWDGDALEIGKVYDVELDIEKVLIWGKDVTLSHNENFSISCEDNVASLYGVLESVDADGYSVLRMGDYIIPFLTQGNSFKIGSRVKITIDSISASPVNY